MMTYQEASKYIVDPLPQTINIKEWGGDLLIKGLTYREYSKVGDQIDLLIESIIEPKVTREFLLKRNSVTINTLIEIVQLKCGVHYRSERFAHQYLEDDSFIPTLFRLAQKLNKNVWSTTGNILDYYLLEIQYWKHCFSKWKEI